MKHFNPWTMSIMAAALAVGAACGPVALAAPAASPHAHEHAHGGTPAPRPESGRKWASDAPLREGMTRIRSLVAPKLDRGSTMTAEESAALAVRIEGEVGTIVANCKLPPQADAALHAILSELMTGTGAMAGRTPQADRAHGLVQVAAAVNDYGRSFEHPGFRPLPAAH
ncbi:hypothetical protein [Ramlibacter alkalitolerans]|uniref:DnrO protein n=1 Tax=Ramlibacter alkalitolerans TaxID=2039631 RepID=A0ABS1JJ24_9BURK|nr:hypothetical protein [Ramlibacter alkalitolerans]MBL0424196.1 hypothetical protein [Ramlibacter alkalitolerans]